MIGDKISMHNLTLIYNENISKKCVDISEEIRREILRILFVNNKIAGIIISDSRFYVSSVELYRVKVLEAESFAYLHLRLGDNNKVWYAISMQDKNKIDESNEFDYSDVKTASNFIVQDLLAKFN